MASYAVTRRQQGQLRIWVDGQLDAQGAGPAFDVSYRDNRNTLYINDPFLVIGAEKHDAGPEFPSYSGFLDELRVSDVMRYDAPFTPPTEPFTPDPNTMALYHMDEGNGDLLLDSAGSTGEPSHGQVRYGGDPAGPVWTTDTPFPANPATPTPTLSTLPATITPTRTPIRTATPTVTPTVTEGPLPTSTPTPTSTATVGMATPTRTTTPLSGEILFLPVVRRR